MTKKLIRASMVLRISGLLKKCESNECKRTYIISISLTSIYCLLFFPKFNFPRGVYCLRKSQVKIRIFLQYASWSPQRHSLGPAGCMKQAPSRNRQAKHAEPGQQVNRDSDKFIFISCLRQPLNLGQVQGKPRNFIRGRGRW